MDGVARRAVRAAGAVACAVVLALLASGCGSSTDTAAAGGDGKHGGQVTIGMDQEPQCLNSVISCGGMTATRMIAGSVFDGMLKLTPEGEYEPLMAVDVPTRENGGVVERPDGGMDVTVQLRPEPRWSDGKPITCEDIRFTWQTNMDDRWQIGSRTGWDLITDVECADERTAVYHFSKVYAPYLSIVGGAPLPKHYLADKDFNKVFNERIGIGSGPFLFDTWNRSVEVLLKRNPDYWDKGEDDQPYLDGIRYVFVADANTLKIQLRTGEVDIISPPPDSTLQEELKGFPRSRFETEPSVYWEQIAFNHDKAPTDDRNVREAIAFSIDRQQITDVVLKKQVEVLNSTLLPKKEEYYLPTWEDVKPDPAKVKQLLEESGYQKDGTYYAKGGKPLTVLFKSTAGNPLRLKVAQLLQQRLKASGIKMDIALEPPAVFFGQSTPQGSYNMALWAWSSGVDPSQQALFSCDEIPSKENDFSGSNNYRYCNERVTELLKESDVTTSVEERAAMVHEVQQLMRKDMALLPLFQRPETLAYSKRAQGLKSNPLESLTWNSYEWSVTKQ